MNADTLLDVPRYYSNYAWPESTTTTNRRRGIFIFALHSRRDIDQYD